MYACKLSIHFTRRSQGAKIVVGRYLWPNGEALLKRLNYERRMVALTLRDGLQAR